MTGSCQFAFRRDRAGSSTTHARGHSWQHVGVVGQAVRPVVQETRDGVVVHHARRYAEQEWREQRSFKLIFIASGRYRLETTAKLRLYPGQFVVLNPRMRHRHLELDGEKLLVELWPESLAEAAEQLGVRMPRFQQLPVSAAPVTRWAVGALDELRSQPIGWRSMLEYAVPELALHLLRLERHLPLPATRSPVGRALDLIRSSYREPLTLDDLAEAAGMERFAFAHAFRRTVGRAPHAQLRAQRLAAAAANLRAGRQRVIDVAFDCGFGSLSSFNRSFRAAYGVTPSQYARLVRE
jgi:AraC-like DNA-binding protein